MRAHHRSVIDWLSLHGATSIILKQNRGKHPKLNFVYNDIHYSHPISGTTSDTYRAGLNFISEIRHRLGLVQPKEKIVTLTPLDISQRNGSFNPVLHTIQEPKKAQTYKGAVAVYANSEGKRHKLNIVAPQPIYTHFANHHLQVTFLAPDTWQFTKAPKGAIFSKNGHAYRLQTYDMPTFRETGSFPITEADMTIVDDTLMVQLATAPVKKTVIVPQEKPTAAPTTNQLVALLDAIRRVEQETEYKVIREKDTGQVVFIHRNPVIR